MGLASDQHLYVLGEEVRGCAQIIVSLNQHKDPAVQSASEAAYRQFSTSMFERLVEGVQPRESDSSDPREREEERAKRLEAVGVARSVLRDLVLNARGAKSVWGKAELPSAFALQMLDVVLSGYSSVLRTYDVLYDCLLRDLPRSIDVLVRKRKIFANLVRVFRLLTAYARYFPSAMHQVPELDLWRVIILLDGDYPPWVHALVLETIHACFSKPKYVAFYGVGNDADSTSKSGTGEQLELIMDKLGRYVKTHYVPNTSIYLTRPQEDSQLRLMDMLNVTQAPDPISNDYLVSVATVCLTSVVDTIAILLNNDHDQHRRFSSQSQSLSVPRKFSPSHSSLAVCRRLADGTWPSILAAMSHLLVNTNDPGYVHLLLKAYQSFTHSCGELSLSVSRDAFLTSMKKVAIHLPPPKKSECVLPPAFVPRYRYRSSDVQTVFARSVEWGLFECDWAEWKWERWWEWHECVSQLRWGWGWQCRRRQSCGSDSFSRNAPSYPTQTHPNHEGDGQSRLHSWFLLE